jgi:glucose-fructose oxidoreductase
MKKWMLAIGLTVVAASVAFCQETKAPVRIAMVGLVHDHALGFIPLLRESKDAVLVGIVEPDHDLAHRYAERFQLGQNLFYDSLDDLLAHTNARAVAIFSSAFGHRAAVEESAAHHLDCMMEKPLAVNLDHAIAIAKAAKKNGVNVIVNYETTWYPGNQEVGDLVRNGDFGELRKVVTHMGHRGPKEIGCSETFLSWLTDPKLNGGGALVDFGCYGADLATWLMGDVRPTSVTCVTQHIKPDIYPKVEDEATVVVTYPRTQAIFQASWNWPFDRKDMEVYGKTGYVIVPTRDRLRVRIQGASKETERAAKPTVRPMTDSVSYLAAIVRKEIQPSGLSALPVNMVATEILDAARKSAATGKRVDLPAKAPYVE